MNTLPRAITAQVLTDQTTFQNLRQCWSELMRSPRKQELSAAHHLLYLALLGKDWRKGFTCITNQRKLENGAYHDWGLFRAMSMLHRTSCEAELLAVFDGVVTLDMLLHIRQLVPYQKKYNYRPDQFSPGNFPFEAYAVPISLQPTLNPGDTANA